MTQGSDGQAPDPKAPKKGSGLGTQPGIGPGAAGGGASSGAGGRRDAPSLGSSGEGWSLGDFLPGSDQVERAAQGALRSEQEALAAKLAKDEASARALAELRELNAEEPAPAPLRPAEASERAEHHAVAAPRATSSTLRDGAKVELKALAAQEGSAERAATTGRAAVEAPAEDDTGTVETFVEPLKRLPAGDPTAQTAVARPIPREVAEAAARLRGRGGGGKDEGGGVPPTSGRRVLALAGGGALLVIAAIWIAFGRTPGPAESTAASPAATPTAEGPRPAPSATVPVETTSTPPAPTASTSAAAPSTSAKTAPPTTATRKPPPAPTTTPTSTDTDVWGTL